MPRDAATSSSSGSSTGPERISGGALKASWPCGDLRIGTRPTPHSWMITSCLAGGPPASSQACAEPSVGWPANGSSRSGVKIRTR